MLKVAKGCGHNHFGEPAWPNEIFYVFPVVIAGVSKPAIGLASSEPSHGLLLSNPFQTPVEIVPSVAVSMPGCLNPAASSSGHLSGSCWFFGLFNIDTNAAYFRRLLCEEAWKLSTSRQVLFSLSSWPTCLPGISGLTSTTLDQPSFGAFCLLRCFQDGAIALCVLL
jgi:hypothetical protein